MMQSTSEPDTRPASYSTGSSNERLDVYPLPLLQQPSALSSPLYTHPGTSDSSIDTPSDVIIDEIFPKPATLEPAVSTSLNGPSHPAIIRNDSPRPTFEVPPGLQHGLDTDTESLRQELFENFSGQNPIPSIESNISPQAVCNADNGYSGEPLSTTPFSPEEEQFLRHPTCGQHPSGAHILDLRYRRRALLFQHFINNLQPVRILSNVGDGTIEMREYPGLCKEDLELLKTVTKTYGDKRWWKIQVDDIACPQCVAELRARRGFKKSKLKQAWLKVKNKVKRICHCRDWEHDFKCTHKTKDSNQVTRFFKALGKKNATRMVNIELDANPYVLLDADTLASAAENLGHYFTDLQRIALHFRFLGPVPHEPEHIDSIVCSMAKMESLLPWRGRLIVDGIQHHDTLKAAWAKKSRKYWE